MDLSKFNLPKPVLDQLTKERRLLRSLFYDTGDPTSMLSTTKSLVDACGSYMSTDLYMGGDPALGHQLTHIMLAHLDILGHFMELHERTRPKVIPGSRVPAK